MGVAPLRALAARLSSFMQESGLADHPPGQGEKISVIIGGKRQEDILCREEIQYPGSEVLITTEDGSLGERGLATHPLAELLSGSQSRQSSPSIIYACGPRPMLARVAQMAAQAMIPCQVSLEEYMACGIGACMGCVVRTGDRADSYQLVCKDGPVFEAGMIQW
jgi:dihydroorotate dehydrogenase electron transfer subunit